VPAAVSDAGNGYKIALPEAKAAGFSSDDGYRQVSLRGFSGVICVYKGSQSCSVDDPEVIRSEQLGHG